MLSGALVVGLGVAGAGLWSVGLGAIALLLFAAAAQPHAGESRYRPDVWHRSDTVASGVALGVLTTFVLLAALAPAHLTYYPYPLASWPTFEPAVAMGVLLLVLPGWLRSDR